MAVNPDQVRHIARLARLGDVDADAMARELSGILDHVEILERELGDLPGSSSTSASSGGTSAASTSPVADLPGGGSLRADVPGSDPLGERPAGFAPGFRDGFFTVPRLASHEQPEGDADGDGDVDTSSRGELEPDG